MSNQGPSVSRGISITRASTETTRAGGATRSITKGVSIGVSVATTWMSTCAEKGRQSVDSSTIYARARVGQILVLTREEIEQLLDDAVAEEGTGR